MLANEKPFECGEMQWECGSRQSQKGKQKSAYFFACIEKIKIGLFVGLLHDSSEKLSDLKTTKLFTTKSQNRLELLISFSKRTIPF